MTDEAAPDRGEVFVRAFHARRPGVTRTAFARGGSYDLVAAAVPAGARVVELGCGDGALLARLVARGHDPARLLGVDVSRDELGAARGAGAAAVVAHARAQALPLRDGAIDAVVSHLALMVMGPLDPVVAEVARVLRPGGVMIAAIGGGPAGTGDGADAHAFDVFVRALAPAVAAAGGAPRLGDPRLRSAAGLRAALAPLGGEVTWTDHSIVLDGALDEVWSTLASAYELAVLDARAVAAVRAAFDAGCAPLVGEVGVVPCRMYVRVVRATRG